jgi:uncharacterized protein YukE
MEPQDILDSVHELDFAALYDETLSKKERAANIKVAKQKLRIIKKNLKEQQTIINRRWDGRNSAQAAMERIELLPYNVLGQVLDYVETAFVELETANNFDRAIPVPPDVGRVIVHDETEAVITSERGAYRWMIEKANESLADAENYAESYRQRIKTYFLIRTGIVVTLAVLYILNFLTITVFTINTWLFTAFFFGVLILFQVLIVLDYRRNGKLRTLESQIDNLKNERAKLQRTYQILGKQP